MTMVRWAHDCLQRFTPAPSQADRQRGVLYCVHAHPPQLQQRAQRIVKAAAGRPRLPCKHGAPRPPSLPPHASAARPTPAGAEPGSVPQAPSPLPQPAPQEDDDGPLPLPQLSLPPFAPPPTGAPPLPEPLLRAHAAAIDAVGGDGVAHLTSGLLADVESGALSEVGAGAVRAGGGGEMGNEPSPGGVLTLQTALRAQRERPRAASGDALTGRRRARALAPSPSRAPATGGGPCGAAAAVPCSAVRGRGGGAPQRLRVW
jgi:hypothetical protein